MKALLLLLLLAGCAKSYYREVRMSDGSVGYTVDCSRTKSQCFERAGLACGEKGYVVLDAEADKGFAASGSVAFAAARTTRHNSMLIKCKP